ncbi:MAG: DUF86 domain-containing protein [Patescibacteria group bacterium]
MTLDHQSIIEKKVKLQQAIRVLEDLGGRTLENLQKDEIEMGAVLHYLALGIESILDIGSHILTEDFGTSPQTYEEVIQLLGQKKVISMELAKQSSGIGKFRNKMIHEYSHINFEKVYGYLQKTPKELKRFDQAFSRYLKKRKKSKGVNSI